MKKYLPFIIIGVVLVTVGLAVFLFLKFRNSSPQAPSKLAEVVNTVPVSDRPYVTLMPASAGKHPVGTEVEITVHNTTLGATKADYELEYQAGSLLQGAFGSLDFIKDKPPVSKVLLLGTCSAGGKCDYNKDVVGGTLLLRLSGGEQKFAVKGEWSYQLMSEREGKFASRDSKFRVDVGAKGLPAGTWVVIMQTMGLPDGGKGLELNEGEGPAPSESEGEIVAGPYHITAGANTVRLAELSWRVGESDSQLTLLGWSGSSWKEYKSTVSDGTLTAAIDRLTTFVAVSSGARN